jgi:hypothetical protein
MSDPIGDAASQDAFEGDSGIAAASQAYQFDSPDVGDAMLNTGVAGATVRPYEEPVAGAQLNSDVFQTQMQSSMFTSATAAMADNAMSNLTDAIDSTAQQQGLIPADPGADYPTPQWQQGGQFSGGGGSTGSSAFDTAVDNAVTKTLGDWAQTPEPAAGDTGSSISDPAYNTQGTSTTTHDTTVDPNSPTADTTDLNITKSIASFETAYSGADGGAATHGLYALGSDPVSSRLGDNSDIWASPLGGIDASGSMAARAEDVKWGFTPSNQAQANADNSDMWNTPVGGFFSHGSTPDSANDF